METGEPTVELLKEYKEQLMAAAAARDKTALLGVLGKLDSYPYVPREVLGRSALGLAVGRLRDHETPEVSEKAKALVARWVASAPARKKQESPSKSTQISQKESLRRSGSNAIRRLSAKRTSASRQPSNTAREQTSASARSDVAPSQTMGPPADPVSRGRKLARTDTGNTKKSASMSVSARSVSKVSNAMSVDDVEPEATRFSQDTRKPSRSTQPKTSFTQPKTSSTQPKISSTQPQTSSTQPKALSTQPKTSSAAPTKPTTPPTRTFETDGLGDASALHEVPLRALTIELFYDALAAGAGDIPPRSLLPKAMSVEDVIYLDTAASLDDYDENAHIEASARTAHTDAYVRIPHTDASARTAPTAASARVAHTDAYVRCAHSAFIALSSASDISTMRSDLLKGDISAEDFVDYVLGEEDREV